MNKKGPKTLRAYLVQYSSVGLQLQRTPTTNPKKQSGPGKKKKKKRTGALYGQLVLVSTCDVSQGCSAISKPRRGPSRVKL